jgi:hypothetical protein
MYNLTIGLYENSRNFKINERMPEYVNEVKITKLCKI